MERKEKIMKRMEEHYMANNLLKIDAAASELLDQTSVNIITKYLKQSLKD